MKHIPGPWTYWSDRESVGSLGGYFIAPLSKLPVFAHVYNYPGKTEANAQLISEAPDLLEACKENQITNIIVASSAAVYGDCNDSNVHLSENSKIVPVSPYGESKLEMEINVKEFSKMYQLNAVILRFFNIYGIGQSPEYAGVITKFLQKIKENKSLEIFGDGLQTRDFVSIHDVMDSIFDTIANIEDKRGNIYNIASGKSISINDLAALMISISGNDLKIIHSSLKKGDIRFSLADISLAKKDLGFQPKIDLKDGIRNLMEI